MSFIMELHREAFQQEKMQMLQMKLGKLCGGTLSGVFCLLYLTVIDKG